MGKKTLWIIGGGQLQVPLISEARKLGLLTLVTDNNPRCIASTQADYFYKVDIFDIAANIDLLLRLWSEKRIALAGVLAAGIDANITAAVLARVAGLPGVHPSAAYITHHKTAFRQFLSENGLPSPAWQEVATLAEARDAIRKVGVPFIVKNIDNSASRGMRKFFSLPTDGVLQTAVAAACAASSTKKALIEELVYGPEQTVETLFDIKGNFHPCFITDRHFDPKNKWAVETGLRHPTVLPLATQKKLYALTKKTADLLGITQGAAKADMILTARGPMMLEMTTRLSGGFDSQYLVPAATGKNVLRAAILTAIGKVFPRSLLVDTRKCVGVTGSVWPKPGRIVSIKGVEKARKLPGVAEIFLRVATGDRIQPYTDAAKRACFIIAVGADEAEASQALALAQKTIKIVTTQ